MYYFVLRTNRVIYHLALIHTLKLFQSVTKTAPCIPVVQHSLRNVRLSHVLVVSVGSLLAQGDIAGNWTSYKKLKGWRKVVTVCSHPHSLRVQFASSPLPTGRVHFRKPLGSLDYHRNNMPKCRGPLEWGIV